MPPYVLDHIGNCRRCDAEVEVWRTPRGKDMLVDGKPGSSYSEGHQLAHEEIDDLLSRFHYSEGGKCTNPRGRPVTEETPRDRYTKAAAPKPGKAHLCRGCRNGVLESYHRRVCTFASKGGNVWIQTWTMDKVADSPQFARDFVQACTGFTPRPRP